MTNKNTTPTFGFGENWSRFISQVDDRRIEIAKQSILDKLELKDLNGKSFLDVGSGSGLFSLAARLLGATVYSFDYDPQSVACTRLLKERYLPDDLSWTIDHGSVLDEGYLTSLGQFDIVYAWGVLHHTGNMWKALDLIYRSVAPDGYLYIAIYNDQFGTSRRWAAVKRLYNRWPIARFPLLFASLVRTWGLTFLRDSLYGRPLHSWRNYFSVRGMSPWSDLVDWVGGYPFEVARPEQIFLYYRDRGMTLRHLTTCGGGLGCNEFVFKRTQQ